ncbi:MAG: adenylyl-sulfate kinase [Chloroflexota bacterium]
MRCEEINVVAGIKTSSLYKHQHTLSHAERVAIKPHRPACLWFTGLSGSGKSTIANAVEVRLNRDFHAHTYLLDGDNIRSGLNGDLGFSPKDRTENIRRLSEVAKLFVDAGLIVLTAFISPFAADRRRARQIVPADAFVEIYIDCPLAVCEGRDPKGLYRQARRGEVAEFTGISSPYEIPEQPELVLHSGDEPVAACAERVVAYLQKHGFLTMRACVDLQTSQVRCQQTGRE